MKTFLWIAPLWVFKLFAAPTTINGEPWWKHGGDMVRR